jgi:hypothetical protein
MCQDHAKTRCIYLIGGWIRAKVASNSSRKYLLPFFLGLDGDSLINK